jgi:hypothetical protein
MPQYDGETAAVVAGTLKIDEMDELLTSLRRALRSMPAQYITSNALPVAYSLGIEIGNIAARVKLDADRIGYRAP